MKKDVLNKSEVDNASLINVIDFIIFEDMTVSFNVTGDKDFIKRLQMDRNITDEMVNKSIMGNIVRGYPTGGLIKFYKTSDFGPIDEEKLMSHIKLVGGTACQHFGLGTYKIWNGIKNPKTGDEQCPVEIPYSVMLAHRFGRKYEDLKVTKISK